MGMKKEHMRRLDGIFAPKSIAVIGASQDKDKVGYGVFRNIISSDYEGNVYPVNNKRKKILKRKSYNSINDIEDNIDIAIIAIPSKGVLKVVKECAHAKVKGVIILSSGFMESGEKGIKLSNEIKKVSREHKMRIMGPNCMGFIKPSISLNASFSKEMPKKGKMAFISQSGALGSSTLDWALKYDLGFSFFASLGSMIDISFSDLIDYLKSDPDTTSIAIYMESLSEARRFISAARALPLNKPIIVLKAGESKEGAKAALSHTGSLTGNDEVFNAAFKRAGIVRVEKIGDLFDCAKTLSKQKRPQGNRIAIITNAGGPGVISTDFLVKRGGELARLSKYTIKELNKILSPDWSKSNPIDLLGDATNEEYTKALDLCLKDDNVDGVLVLLTPQTMTDSEKIARSISKVESQKPILASFMGGQSVKKAKEILESNEIPNFPFPERAVNSFMYLYDYGQNIKSLYDTPGSIPHAFDPDTEKNKRIINKAMNEGRNILLETEVKEFLKNYSIPVIEQTVCSNKSECIKAAKKIGYPIAMKILSKEIIHKTDVGGVALNIRNKKETEEAYETMMKNIKKNVPKSNDTKVIISKILNKRHELIIGSKKDPIFGPTIIFGMGGVAVDIFKDVQIGLPPLNMHLSHMLIKDTKIYKLLKGYRGMPEADLKQLEFILYKFSYLVSDFPEIKEIDINPFAIDETGGIVLDAKIILDKRYFKEKNTDKRPYSHLAISPYPKELIRKVRTKDNKPVTLRPIKPEDEPMEREMFKKFSKKTERFRFFGEIKKVDHDLLIKYTHNDYDRELGIMAEIEENKKKKMAGVVRIIIDPYEENAEFAIVVADPWQGNNIGNQMMDYMLEVAKKRGIRKLYAYLLKDNVHMKDMFIKRGFTINNEEKALRAEKILNI